MFGLDDVLLASLIGGGLGAITNKKNPLKGGMMGAGIGAIGGGLLSPASAAASAQGAGGLLANPLANAEAAAAYGTNLGSQQTAMLAAQDAGLGSSGVLGAMKQAKPFVDAAGTGMQVASQFKDDPVQQIQGQPLQQRPPDYNGLITNPEQMILMDAETRKKLYQQFARNAMGA